MTDLQKQALYTDFITTEIAVFIWNFALFIKILNYQSFLQGWFIIHQHLHIEPSFFELKNLNITATCFKDTFKWEVIMSSRIPTPKQHLTVISNIPSRHQCWIKPLQIKETAWRHPTKGTWRRKRQNLWLSTLPVTWQGSSGDNSCLPYITCEPLIFTTTVSGQI